MTPSRSQLSAILLALPSKRVFDCGRVKMILLRELAF
jgi:hypothetical protein